MDDNEDRPRSSLDWPVAATLLGLFGLVSWLAWLLYRLLAS